MSLLLTTASLFRSGVLGLVAAALAVVLLCAVQLAGLSARRPSRGLATITLLLTVVTVILIIGHFAALA